jgi:hypothetical protein
VRKSLILPLAKCEPVRCWDSIAKKSEVSHRCEDCFDVRESLISPYMDIHRLWRVSRAHMHAAGLHGHCTTGSVPS